MSPPLHKMPPEANQVIISANPRAGARSSKDEVRQLVRLLEGHGLRAEVLHDLDEVAARTRRLRQDKTLRAVVAAGGDGTAHELVNRIEPGIPLAVLPLGIENLLAKYVGQSPGPQAACRTIIEGTVVRLDAGRANGRFFVLMASCGFDAEVTRRLHRRRTGHISYWTYARHVLGAIRGYQYPQMQIRCRDEQGRDIEPIGACWAFMFNLPGYFASLPFAPDADGTDGLLNLCTFRHGSLGDGLRYLAWLVFGKHGPLADCVMTKASRIVVQSSRPVPYQLDGDPMGWLPLEIEIVPDRLTLLVPQSGVIPPDYTRL